MNKNDHPAPEGINKFKLPFTEIRPPRRMDEEELYEAAFRAKIQEGTHYSTDVCIDGITLYDLLIELRTLRDSYSSLQQKVE